MHWRVSTKDPAAVQAEAQAACQAMFPEGDTRFIEAVFGWAVECFSGRYGDYQAVDAEYHDLEHTLQGTLCMVRLLRGRHAAGATPQLSQRTFELALLAILLHDSGYLKHRVDREGTGAKYTEVHVARSMDFAAELMRGKGFSPTEIQAVQNMISCTGVKPQVPEITFQTEEERIAGLALVTADYLGQMAADDYLEKLPTLYEEFNEAVHYSGSKGFISQFASAEELIRNTPQFWKQFVKPKLERDFQGLHRFLNDPYPSGPNPYIEKIEANVARAERHAAARSR